MNDELIEMLRATSSWGYDLPALAADRIEELEKENEVLHEDRANMKAAAKKALKNATEMDNWHRYGEGYEVLTALVKDMIKDKEND